MNGVTANHSDINFAWTCGDRGTILYTADGGTTWITQESGTTANLYSIAFLEMIPGPVIAVGDSGIILKTSDNGTTWERLPSPTTRTLRDICDFSNFIVGDSGTILYATEFAISFEAMESPTTVRLNAVSGTFSVPLITGDDGVVLRKLGSNPWQFGTSGTTADLFNLPLFSNSNLIVGEGGLVLRSSNFGQSWFPQNAPATATLKAVEFSVNNTSHIYAVGDRGTIIKSTDEGISWVVQESGTINNLNSAFFYLDDSNGWVVGDSGTILRTRDGGWTPPQGTAISPSAVPQSVTLHQNYPNPFNASTTIRFDLTEPTVVTVKVYDMLGREIAVLLSADLPSGSHVVNFNAKDLASGIYFYTLQTATYTSRKKMLFLK
ncbi:MAG: YCF48-related protein [Calditrichota bacterium]